MSHCDDVLNLSELELNGAVAEEIYGLRIAKRNKFYYTLRDLSAETDDPTTVGETEWTRDMGVSYRVVNEIRWQLHDKEGRFWYRTDEVLQKIWGGNALLMAPIDVVRACLIAWREWKAGEIE